MKASDKANRSQCPLRPCPSPRTAARLRGHCHKPNNNTIRHTACSQWCDSCYILQYVHLMNYVRNDEVRWTIGQPRLSAIVQARRLSLFGHIARMPDETDARGIITASPSENWRRPPGRPRTTWMKTIQPLRSNNLSLDEAITVAQNRPLWRLMSLSASGTTHP